jgi:hypothetical protein
MDGGFRMEGHWAWGGSVIKGEMILNYNSTNRTSIQIDLPKNLVDYNLPVIKMVLK